MKKNFRKIGIGPMSPEVVEAVYKYSDINNVELMLIASKNQIDYSSGYVNNWNTKKYSQFCKNLKKKLKTLKYYFVEIIVAQDSMVFFR